MKNELIKTPREVNKMIGASKIGLPVFVATFAAISLAYAGGQQEDMKPNACKGPTLCNTRPNVDSNDFFFDAGFLLEQARVTGTMFGYLLNNNAAQGASAESAVGQRPSFNVDWGLTVAAGRHFQHDDWDLVFSFDWLSSTGNSKTNTEYGQTFVPVNLRSDGVVNGTTNLLYTTNANSTLKVNYYMLDAVIGRGSYLGGCSSITPHFGLKAAWMGYKNTVKLTGGNVPAGTVYYLVKNDSFWGVGPDVGIDAMFGMSEGLSIFIDNSAGILLGYSSINDHSWSNFNASGLTMTYNESGIPMMSPTLKMYLGIMYERSVYYGCQNLRVKGGWDTAFYFNQFMNAYILNEIAQPGSGVSNPRFHTAENNTFSLTGLRIDVCWDF